MAFFVAKYQSTSFNGFHVVTKVSVFFEEFSKISLPLLTRGYPNRQTENYCPKQLRGFFVTLDIWTVPRYEWLCSETFSIAVFSRDHEKCSMLGGESIPKLWDSIFRDFSLIIFRVGWYPRMTPARSSRQMTWHQLFFKRKWFWKFHLF